MKSAYPVVETIKTRRSVRTYEDRRLAPELINKINAYISGLSNPFGANVRISMVQKQMGGNSEKLGTYGTIKGASTFLGLSVAHGPQALLGAGFQFEDLILYLTSLGLGTVWLAATFSRSKFQKAMEIPEDYLFPAISPVGYPEKKRFFEKIMRKTLGADNRKPWSDMFYTGDFRTPVTEAEAGEYATALDMVRLAPSATNAQPWRILKVGDTFHFYEMHKNGARDEDALIKQVDLGIATFHFFKTLQSQGVEGSFSTNEPRGISVPPTYHYVTSWNRKQ